MSEILNERDAAIAVLAQVSSKYIVNEGAQLAQIIGPELAAEITAGALGELMDAFAALGVTEDDIRRVGAALSSDQFV